MGHINVGGNDHNGKFLLLAALVGARFKNTLAQRRLAGRIS